MGSKIIFTAILLCIGTTVLAQKVKEQINDTLTVQKTVLYHDSFKDGLQNWKVEQMPGGTAATKNEKLEITDVAGCTIWFKKELEGPIMIQYDAYVIDEGDPKTGFPI